MAKVILQFYKSESHYKGDSSPFFHELSIQVLPKVGEKFEYQEWMFNLMEPDKQKEFTDNFQFQIGEYYVIEKTEYSEKNFRVKYSFYLIEQRND